MPVCPPGLPYVQQGLGSIWCEMGWVPGQGCDRLQVAGVLQQAGVAQKAVCLKTRGLSQVPLDCPLPGIPTSSLGGEKHPNNT